MTGDIEASDATFILAHEHVYCDVAASGDPDLAFTATDRVAKDLSEARQDGVTLLVELSTYDMGGDPLLTETICTAAGLRVVKGTGWCKSPWLDPLIAGQTTEALTTRLITDLREGFDKTAISAGVIGEIGISGETPTPSERRSFDAAAAACLATGAGIVAHTDSWENAILIVEELTARNVPSSRTMLAHCRCADPIADQLAATQAGITLAFDQLGHPKRDRVPAVAERIAALIDEGASGWIAVSADVGRRSRLRSQGGSGYIRPVRQLLTELAALGVDRASVRDLISAAPARFLSWSAPGVTS